MDALRIERTSPAGVASAVLKRGQGFDFKSSPRRRVSGRSPELTVPGAQRPSGRNTGLADRHISGILSFALGRLLHWICFGLALDWRWAGDGLAMDWRRLRTGPGIDQVRGAIGVMCWRWPSCSPSRRRCKGGHRIGAPPS